jgi:hypothetical protein
VYLVALEQNIIFSLKGYNTQTQAFGPGYKKNVDFKTCNSEIKGNYFTNNAYNQSLTQKA